jgi:hypothetical protein
MLQALTIPSGGGLVEARIGHKAPHVVIWQLNAFLLVLSSALSINEFTIRFMSKNRLKGCKAGIPSSGVVMGDSSRLEHSPASNLTSRPTLNSLSHPRLLRTKRILVFFLQIVKFNCCAVHGRMGRGGQGLLKVSPEPAMSYPSTPCEQAIPETALWPFQEWSTRRAGGLRPSSTPLDTPYYSLML